MRPRPSVYMAPTTIMSTHYFICEKRAEGGWGVGGGGGEMFNFSHF